jgi:hypothetical protein
MHQVFSLAQMTNQVGSVNATGSFIHCETQITLHPVTQWDPCGAGSVQTASPSQFWKLCC